MYKRTVQAFTQHGVAERADQTSTFRVPVIVDGTGMDAENDKYRTPLPVQGADCSHSALSSCDSFSDDFSHSWRTSFKTMRSRQSSQLRVLLSLPIHPAGHPDRIFLPERLHEHFVESCVTECHNDSGGRVKRSETYTICMSAWPNSAQSSKLDLQRLYMACASQCPVTVMPCRPGQTIWKLKSKLNQSSLKSCKHANGSLKHRMPCWRTPFHRRLTLMRNTYTHWWGSMACSHSMLLPIVAPMLALQKTRFMLLYVGQLACNSLNAANQMQQQHALALSPSFVVSW